MTGSSLAKLKPFGDAKNSTGAPVSQSSNGSSILPSMMSLNLTNNTSANIQRQTHRTSAH
jgi:hypothetical protein